MNINCEIQLPTKIIFKENAYEDVAEAIKKHNFKKVLFLYGMNSIKKIGLYDKIVQNLKTHHIDFVEFSGIRANPVMSDVDKAAQLAIKEKCDLILAVGGGSVVDSAKAIGLTATNHVKTGWELWTKKQPVINNCLPIFAFITLAATGSENNMGSVITNEQTQEKFGFGHSSCMPLIAFEDPTVTYSINQWHTACGAFDMFTHCFERILSKQLIDWTKNYLIANMKTAVTNSYRCLQNPSDLQARANLLFTSSMALNDLGDFANADGDWTIHNLEHGFSALYDMSHGAGLALVMPYFLEHHKNNAIIRERVEIVGKEVFEVKGFENSLNAIKKWIIDLGLHLKTDDFKNLNKNIDKAKDIDWLVNHFKARLVVNGLQTDELEMGAIVKTNLKDAKEIYLNTFK